MVEAAVTRALFTEPDTVLGKDERASVKMALRAVTSVPAFQLLSESEIGSLEIGKLADFVVLSENPLTIAEDKLADIHVVTTIKEDTVIYQRSEESATITSPAQFGITQLKEHGVGPELEIDAVCGDGEFNPAFSVLVDALEKRSGD